MYFRQICLFIIYTIVLSACSFDTSDNKSKEIIELGGASLGLSCIENDVIPFFNDGIDNASMSEADTAFICINQSIDLIDEHINVKTKKPISIDSIKRIVQKKIPSYGSKTESVINVFFSVKYKFLKGNKTSVTHAELKKLKQLMLDLKQVYKLLHPGLLLLNKKRADHVPRSQVDLAADKLLQAESYIAELFTKYKLSITKKDLEGWFSPSALMSKSDFKEKWDLYWAFHRMLWSQQKDSFNYTELDVWLEGTRSIFEATIKEKHKWKFANYINGTDTNDILFVSDKLLETLYRAIERREDKTISYSEIFHLLEKVQKIYGLPHGLQLKTLEQVIPIATEKLIGVPEEISSKPEYYNKVHQPPFEAFYSGITSHHMKSLLVEYNLYKNIQLSIIRGEVSPSYTYAGFQSEHLTNFVNIIKSVKGYFPEDAEISDLNSIDSSGLVTSTEERKKTDYGLYISKDIHNNFNKRNLTMYNFFNTVARAVARGYNIEEDHALRYQSISVEKIALFIYEFEQFFAEVYLMEKRSPAFKVAERIYLESKVFVSTGDGYGLSVVNGKSRLSRVTNVESMETMAHYISGVFTNAQVFDELHDVCSLEALGMSPEDVSPLFPTVPKVFGRMPLVKSCFKEHYLSVLIKYIDNLPGLKSYIINYLSKKEQAIKEIEEKLKKGWISVDFWKAKFDDTISKEFNFVENLIFSGQETLLRFKDGTFDYPAAMQNSEIKNDGRYILVEDNPYVTKADFSIMGTLLYFVESGMLKFDKDNNQSIDFDEVDTSYQYLKGLIQTTKFKHCTDAAFRYILLAAQDEAGILFTSKNLGECAGATSKNIAKIAFKASWEWIKKWGNKTKGEELAQQARDIEVERAREIVLQGAKTKVLNINPDGRMSVDRKSLLEIISFQKKK